MLLARLSKETNGSPPVPRRGCHGFRCSVSLFHCLLLHAAHAVSRIPDIFNQSARPESHRVESPRQIDFESRMARPQAWDEASDVGLDELASRIADDFARSHRRAQMSSPSGDGGDSRAIM